MATTTKKQPITERVKTFEDACSVLNIDPAAVISNFEFFPEHHRKAMAAHAKLIIIAEALNEGYRPDWNNNSEYKYYPWFDMEDADKSQAGSGFSFGDYVYWLTDSNVGSRLCFKTRELAKYAGEQFKELYKDYFLFI